MKVSLIIKKLFKSNLSLQTFFRFIFALSVIFICLDCSAVELKAQESHIPDDLTDLSIDDLLKAEVISVAKKPQSLYDAAAAVFVITQEDIRRSGATSIPEALRLAPGLHVARIDVSKWAISSRGFNGQWANKLLVLMDGRTVYSSLFSGVYWEVQDTFLDDVLQIEVIRGPGASLWGANAVNGVINIITKPANDTQSGRINVSFGNDEKMISSLRYGGKAGKKTHWRVYAKVIERNMNYAIQDSEVSGGIAEDVEYLRSGFRVDSKLKDNDSITFQGDIYTGKNDTIQLATSPTSPYRSTFSDQENVSGGNLLARWHRDFSESENLDVQVYYDRTERDNAVLREIRDILDLDIQGQYLPNPRHELKWGFGLRFNQDSTDGSFSVSFNPTKKKVYLYSFFVQDEFNLVQDKLLGILGVKVEHNDYSGFEVQPNARLRLRLDTHKTLWAAISRAVRTPSRSDHGIAIHPYVIPPFSGHNTSPYPIVGEFSGAEDFKPEELIAFEIGYREAISDIVSVDIATFYNVYNDLQTFESGAPSMAGTPNSSYMSIPFVHDNKMKGETYGLEAFVEWRLLDWWRWKATYTYLHVQLQLDSDSLDSTSIERHEGDSPHNQFSLTSSMKLSENVDLDLWCRYVGNLPTFEIESYTALNAHLAWQPTESFEISVVAKNLLDSEHSEFLQRGVSTIPAQISRSFYGKITWRF